MLRHAAEHEGDREIAAIAPTVFVGEYQASPWQVLFNGHRQYTRGESGPAEGEAAAINSGSLISVAALGQIGGYSEAFWLDYSDWYVFHQFFLHGLRVWKAAELEIQHSMTVMDYDNLMPVWRYKNFIVAEGAFNDLYKGRLENAVQTGRLPIRALKQRLRFKNPEFSKITLSYFWRRLFSSRKRRIRRWQQMTTQRLSARSTKAQSCSLIFFWSGSHASPWETTG